MKARNDDDVSLHPHSVENCAGDSEECERAATDPGEPQQLRNNHIAKNGEPEGPPVRPESAVVESVNLILVTAVPRRERFDQVSVGEDESGAEHHFCGAVEMSFRYE